MVRICGLFQGLKDLFFSRFKGFVVFIVRICFHGKDLFFSRNRNS